VTTTQHPTPAAAPTTVQAAAASERILMVTPYPPIRDGIANYAVQEVKRLRAEGHDVEVLSPGPSAAHHHLDLRGVRGVLALAKRVHRYDRVVIQFHPDVFYPHPCTGFERALVTAALCVVFLRSRNVEARVHEVNYDLGRRPTLHAALSRVLWRSAARLTVHTEAEREGMVKAFRLPDSSVDLFDHGGHFQRRTELDRAGARQWLGLPTESFVFLSIGFIQPHKGFDRAVTAFEALGLAGRSRLDVVGSVRVEEPEYVAYCDSLRRQIKATPGAHLHEEYVSDELFDIWISAADVVVLPYRHIWSSGVMERAELYDRPVIATRVGGLSQQAPAGTVLVEDDDGLRRAMADAIADHAGREDRPTTELAPWPDEPDRNAIMAAVRDRATDARGGLAMTRGGTHVDRAAVARASAISAPLRRVAPLHTPQPTSASPRAAAIKKVVYRLTSWQTGPIVHQINKLQDAIIEVAEAQAVSSAAERDDSERTSPD
jgi:glycosyltransferase involved in cell wall biosynthesis